MDRLLAMQVFLRVVDAGGFSRAADTMQMPKASVTTLIQNLEAHLGAKLLNRTTRRVTVTADGAAYYERCLRILAEIEETESSLSRNRAIARGRLRIDVPVSLGRRIIAPALPDFLARYPEIQLEVGCTDRSVDLLEEGVDCVVRGRRLEDSNLVARRIGVMRMLTCATPAYLERYGIPAAPGDLAHHRCINYFSAKTGKNYDFRFERRGERQAIAVAGWVAVNDGDAYVAAGLAGLGIMQVPAFMVEQEIRAGRLHTVLPDWHTEPIPLHVVYPQNRHLSAKVRIFVEWIADLLDEYELLRLEQHQPY